MEYYFHYDLPSFDFPLVRVDCRKLIQVLVVTAVLTAPSTSFCSSALNRLSDSVSSSSFDGDAERLLLRVVDAVLTSSSILSPLFVWDFESTNGLNCTMTAVILSQPVPSPLVFGAKQAVKS